jgi:hypothetical protein
MTYAAVFCLSSGDLHERISASCADRPAVGTERIRSSPQTIQNAVSFLKRSNGRHR